MARRKVVYVTPGKDKTWNVKEQGVKQPMANFERKADAVEFGKGVAKSAELGQIKIQKTNGVLQAEHTYGQDPRHRKG